MDHLPKISDPQFESPQVPFLVSEHNSYDGKGVSGFRSRYQFSFQNRPDNDPEATGFLQSWLYFGLLQDFLALQHIPLLYDDFINHNGNIKIVTTRYLWDYLAAWLIKGFEECPHLLTSYSDLRLSNLVGQGKNERKRATKIAKTVYDLLEVISDSMSFIQQHRHCIVYTVWDSIIILAGTIENTLGQAYRAYWIGTNKDLGIMATMLGDKALFSEVPSRLVQRLFDEQKWCPRERLALNVIFESDVAVLLSCLKLRRNRTDSASLHRHCTSKRCSAYQVNEETYVTQHVTNGCCCTFVDVGNVYQRPEVPAKGQILGLGIPPIATVTFEKDQLQVVPIAPLLSEISRPFKSRGRGRPKFVAFSHVWAHGRGNPHANALPRCRLERLQSLANSLFPSSTNPVPFWIDTMCIPVDPAGRRHGIDSMEWTFKSASRVLVLDQELMSIKASGLTSEEIGLQIACSAWARRLWTLQEGVFQEIVHYCFEDSLQNYVQLKESKQKEHLLHSKQLGVPPDHFLNEVLNDSSIRELSSAPISENAYKALSFWPRIASFYKQIGAANLGATLLDPEQALADNIRSIMIRSTSKLEDESLVLASMTSRFVGFSDFVMEEPEERYRKFFKSQHKGFTRRPGHLIFLDQRRYEETGSRWIPRSLLTQQMGIEERFNLPRRGEAGVAHEDGLLVWYPGSFVKGSQYLPTVPEHFQIGLYGNCYEARTRDAGSEAYPAKLKAERLQHPVLILQREIVRGRSKSTAVLGEVLNIDEVKTNISKVLERSKKKGPQWGMQMGEFGVTLAKWDLRPIKARHEALVDLVMVGKREKCRLPVVEVHENSYLKIAGEQTKWKVN